MNTLWSPASGNLPTGFLPTSPLAGGQNTGLDALGALGGNSGGSQLLALLLQTLLSSLGGGANSQQGLPSDDFGTQFAAMAANAPAEPTNPPAGIALDTPVTNNRAAEAFDTTGATNAAAVDEPVTRKTTTTPPAGEPRDGELKLAGHRWLARSIDKARLKSEGKLDDMRLLFPCPQDQQLHKELGIESEKFRQIVAANDNDDDIIAALKAAGAKV